MPKSINHWIEHHDERWSFILLYVGGAIALSVYTNLFWVVLLMLGHFGLEVWRHVIIKVNKPVIHALWHVKLDIALVFFALVVALYADMVMAALGLGQAARAGQAVRGAQMLTRFAIIERGLRIFFLTVDDLARVAHIIWKTFGKRGQSVAVTEAAMEDAREKIRQEEPMPVHGIWPWQSFSKGDIFSLGFGSLCLLLIIMAPAITGHGVSETLAVLLDELRPVTRLS